MRLDFDITSPDLEDVRLEVRHSGSFRAFISRIPEATDLDSAHTRVPYPVSAAARAALRPTGNVLAVHAVRNGLTEGAKNINLGLTALQPPNLGRGPTPPPRTRGQHGWLSPMSSSTLMKRSPSANAMSPRFEFAQHVTRRHFLDT